MDTSITPTTTTVNDKMEGALSTDTEATPATNTVQPLSKSTETISPHRAMHTYPTTENRKNQKDTHTQLKGGEVPTHGKLESTSAEAWDSFQSWLIVIRKPHSKRMDPKPCLMQTRSAKKKEQGSEHTHLPQLGIQAPKGAKTTK